MRSIRSAPPRLVPRGGGGARRPLLLAATHPTPPRNNPNPSKTSARRARSAIVDAKEDGAVEQIIERTIDHPGQACTANKAVNKGASVGFEQVAGLW